MRSLTLKQTLIFSILFTILGLSYFLFAYFAKSIEGIEETAAEKAATAATAAATAATAAATAATAAVAAEKAAVKPAVATAAVVPDVTAPTSYVSKTKELIEVKKPFPEGSLPGNKVDKAANCAIIDHDKNVLNKSSTKLPLASTESGTCGKTIPIIFPDSKNIPTNLKCTLSSASTNANFKGICNSGDNTNFYKVSS